MQGLCLQPDNVVHNWLHPCKSLSLKVALTSSTGMVIHELSTTEERTDSSLRHMRRGLIVLPENEKTHSTSTEAAVNSFE